MRRAGAVDACPLRQGGAFLSATRRRQRPSIAGVVVAAEKKKGFGAPAAKPAPADPKKVNKAAERSKWAGSWGDNLFE